MFNKIGFYSLLVTISFVCNNCARNPVTGKSQLVLMSEEQELAMGREADPQIIAQYGLYPDSALQRFINEKGKAMGAISHRKNLDYQFRIVDSDVINAFAVPGGYVYFTRGIMAHFNDEAQFAGVLGHEIGHITARHSVIQQRNAMLGQVGLLAGMILSPKLAQFGQEVSQGLGLLMLKFGRDDERESDKLGVEYSSKIGYDASRMADFFTTLERQQHKAGSDPIPDLLSTHPNPGDRHNTVQELATDMKRQLNLTNPAVNRNTYLRRIEGLIYGEDPRQGFRENNVFYHPELKFQFPTPAGWQYANTPQQVQLAAPDQRALIIFTLAQGKTLQEAAANTLQQFKLTQVESRQTNVNGLPAIAVVADQQQQDGSVIRTLSYFIQQGSTIYHFIGVTSAQDFNNYASTFQGTMEGFRTLTDASKLNKKPERIRIKTVAQSTTLQNALRGFGMADKRMEELAILNGMKLTDNVPAGTLIKTVGQ